VTKEEKRKMRIWRKTPAGQEHSKKLDEWRYNYLLLQLLLRWDWGKRGLCYEDMVVSSD